MPGPLAWKKKLTRTDAQRQQGHPTGDVRLVQAKDNNSATIDQTDFFRNQVFRMAKWTIAKQTPLSEEANVSFEVTIAGHSPMVLDLVVSHKPSGEADQGNYTTNIRWGQTLSPLLQATDVTGLEFRLYYPVAGSNRFFIEIG